MELDQMIVKVDLFKRYIEGFRDYCFESSYCDKFLSKHC